MSAKGKVLRWPWSRNKSSKGGSDADHTLTQEEAQEQIDEAYAILEEVFKPIGPQNRRALIGRGHSYASLQNAGLSQKLQMLIKEYHDTRETVHNQNEEIENLSQENSILRKDLQNIHANHDSEKRAQTAEYLNNQKAWEARLSKTKDRYDEEIYELKCEHRELAERSNAEFARQQEGWQDHLHAAKKRHDHDISQLKAQNQEKTAVHEANLSEQQILLEKQLHALRNGHERALHDLTEKHREELASAEEAHDENVQTISDAHELELEKIEAMLEQNKEDAISQQETLQKEMTKLVSQHGRELEQIKEYSHAALVDSNKTHARELEGLKKSHLQELERVKKAHFQEQERLKEHAKTVQSYLKKDIRSRNNALIARQAFNQLTDGELKSIFLELRYQIDTLARLEWSFNDSDWTEELQNQISDAPKRLRRQILQDTIWENLFRNIFCSPFRVLGEEGYRLEKQWVEDFGKGNIAKEDAYTWPEPSFDSERWRYETLRQCQEVLEKPISDYDARQKLREGFQQSLTRACEQLSEELGKVSGIDDSTALSIQNIAEKACKMWVTFGAQRCRLTITIHGLKTTEESRKTTTSGGRSLELVVRPELKRVGDAEGELFEGVTTVAGCEGEMIKIVY